MMEEMMHYQQNSTLWKASDDIGGVKGDYYTEKYLDYFCFLER